MEAVFHILFNMLWLWWMGKPVEDTLGPRNFSVLYLGAGIGGGLIHVLLSGFADAPTIGASGAVFGMMVVFAMLFPYQQIMLLFLPPIQARYMVVGLIILDVLFLNSGDNIARVVHLGGALWGYLLMRALPARLQLRCLDRFSCSPVRRRVFHRAAANRARLPPRPAAVVPAIPICGL